MSQESHHHTCSECQELLTRGRLRAIPLGRDDLGISYEILFLDGPGFRCMLATSSGGAAWQPVGGSPLPLEDHRRAIVAAVQAGLLKPTRS